MFVVESSDRFSNATRLYFSYLLLFIDIRLSFLHAGDEDRVSFDSPSTGIQQENSV